MNRILLIAGAVMLTVAAAAAAADNDGDILGKAEPASGAARTIVIGSNIDYVNLERGEIVNFVVGDKSFAWSFATAGTISELDLNDIAPPGLLDHRVKAYIKRLPLYDGG